MMRFWDPTAVTAVVMGEERLWPLCASRGMVVSWNSPLGCAYVLQSQQDLAKQKRRRLEWHLERLLLSAHRVQPIERVLERALRVLQIHEIAPEKALELASALVWCKERPHGEEFVSLDPELREAAEAEGFTVLPEHGSFPGAEGAREPA